MVDSIFAVSTAGRCGTTMTDSTNRSFAVMPAMNDVVANCSSQAAAVPAGNSPVFV